MKTRTHAAMMLPCLAALSLGANALAGQTRFDTIRLDYVGQTQAHARSGPSDAFDERNFQDNLRFVGESEGVPGEPVFANRSIGAQSAINLNRAEAEGGIEAMLTGTHARFRLNADFNTSAFGQNGDAEATFNLNGTMRVRTTEEQRVEFTLRLLLGGLSGHPVDVDAIIGLQGLTGTAQPQIEIQNPGSGEEALLTLEADLPAQQFVTMNFNAAINLNAFDNESATVSDFVLLGEARIVPAPGALASAALLGLAGSRRRR